MIARLSFIICLFVIFVPPRLSSAETVQIVTRANAVRESCRFFSPVVAKVGYGDSLDVISREGDWLKVRFEGAEGCIHNSAVTEKKIRVAKKKDAEDEAPSKSDASKEEVALAGKGFNPAVEKKYREDNPDLDFELVDSIEAYSVPDDAVASFIDEGGLNRPQ